MPATQQQNFRKDYFWNTIASFVANGTWLILSIFISRVNGVQALGDYSYATGIVIIFSMLMAFGGQQYFVTDTANEFAPNNYFWATIIYVCGGYVVALPAVFILNFTHTQTIIYIIMLTCNAFMNVSAFFGAVLQIKNKIYLSSQFTCIRAALSFLGFLITDYTTRSLYLSCAVFCGLTVITTLGLYLPRVGKEGLYFSKPSPLKPIGQITKKLFYLMVTSFLTVAILNIIRIFIEHYHINEQGQFSVCLMPLTLLSLVSGLLIAPHFVPLSNNYQNNRAIFSATITKLLKIVVGFGLLTLVISYFLAMPVLGFIYHLQLSQYRGAFCLMLLAGILTEVRGIYFCVFTIMRRIKIAPMLLAILLVVEIIVAFILIPKFSILGAAITYIIINALASITCYLIYNGKIPAVP